MAKIKTSEISIIIQGPITDVTDKTVNNVREFFPESEIIVSTWEGSNYKNDLADVIIESKDPKGYPFCDSPKILNPSNRQIVSTLAGLKKATRKYAIKMRSDMYFENTNFLEYFDKFKKRSEENKILKERVLLSTSFAPNPKRGEAKPYHPSDWFYFGLREDLTDIFDVPLCKEPDTSRYFETHKKPKVKYDFWVDCLSQYNAEQYIWVSFLKKHIELDFNHCYDIEKGNIEKSEQIFANNAVLLDAVDIRYNSYKHNGLLHTNFDLAFMYTHYEWQKMYKKYCDKKHIMPLIDKEKIRRLYLSIKYKRRIKYNLRAFFNICPKNTVKFD